MRAMEHAIDAHDKAELRRLANAYPRQWEALCLRGYQGCWATELEDLLVRDRPKWPVKPKSAAVDPSTAEVSHV